jgi:hypothetical protein
MPLELTVSGITRSRRRLSADRLAVRASGVCGAIWKAVQKTPHPISTAPTSHEGTRAHSRFVRAVSLRAPLYGKAQTSSSFQSLLKLATKLQRQQLPSLRDTYSDKL